jgi:molecular chaperone DnaK (HSP70)
VSVLEVSDGLFEVKANYRWYNKLGGDDFDRQIVNYLAGWKNFKTDGVDSAKNVKSRNV